MGCAPYYAVTGTHPLIPHNIVKANYLQPPPSSLLATTDLIVRRAVALQKRSEDLERLQDRIHQARNKAALHFEQEHSASIRDFNFQRGALVLVRNTAIEKALNRKMRPRYTGPMVVVSRNRGSAYILCELDGTLAHSPFAAFRIIPYFARSQIEVPDLKQHLNVSISRLREMEAASGADQEDDGRQSEDEDDNGINAEHVND